MPLAILRQMIETGKTEANVDEKESASLKFQTASENFDSGYGYDSNRNSILCGIITSRIDS